MNLRTRYDLNQRLSSLPIVVGFLRTLRDFTFNPKDYINPLREGGKSQYCFAINPANRTQFADVTLKINLLDDGVLSSVQVESPCQYESLSEETKQEMQKRGVKTRQENGKISFYFDGITVLGDIISGIIAVSRLEKMLQPKTPPPKMHF